MAVMDYFLIDNCIMSNLNFNIKQEIAVLEKYKLNPTEFFVLRLLLLIQDDENMEEEFYKFLSIKCINLREILVSLQGKGMILKSYKIPQSGEEIDLYSILINKNVTKTFHKASFDMGNELFNAYPKWTYINGKAVALRNPSKKWNSPEDSFRYYGKTINWNPEIHKHILELIEWGKQQEVINFGYCSFIIDRRWEDLEAMKDGKVSNICFDSFTDI